MQDPSGYGGYGGGYGPPPPGDYGHTAPLPPMPPPPPRRRVGLLSYVAVALVAGALGAGSVVALYHPASNSTAAPSARPSAPVPLPSTAVPMPGNGGTGTAGGSLAKAGQGVVIINTTLQYSSERAAGTGMVINAARGLVLTNNHVIENSTKISATVAATGQNFQARVVGYDVTGDIALIHAAAPVRPAPGSARRFRQGQGGRRGDRPGQRRGPQPDRLRARAHHRGGQDHHGQRPGRLGHLGDAARDVPDRRGHRVRRLGRPAGQRGRPGHRHGHGLNDVRMPDQQAAAGFAIPGYTALSVAKGIAAGHASSTISIGYPPFIGIYVGQGTSSDPQQQAQEQQQQNNNGFGGFGGGNGFGGNGSTGNGQGQGCFTSYSTCPCRNRSPRPVPTLVIGTICASPAATAGVTAGSVITSVSCAAVGAPQTLHTALSKFRPGDTVSLTWVTPSGQHKTASMTLKEGPPEHAGGHVMP